MGRGGGHWHHTETVRRGHVICVYSWSMSDPQLYKFRRLRSQFHTRVEVGSNTSTVTLRVVRGDEKWSLKCETVKYGHESQGIQTRERLRWQGPAAYTKDKTRSLVIEDAPQKQDRNCQRIINIWGGSTPRPTGWLTVNRNVTLTLSQFQMRTLQFSSRWGKLSDSDSDSEIYKRS
jgi:hypothetical protein